MVDDYVYDLLSGQLGLKGKAAVGLFSHLCEKK